jgi:hypothetical protein
MPSCSHALHLRCIKSPIHILSSFLKNNCLNKSHPNCAINDFLLLINNLI